ncbi:MAG TPA: gephyrin-like molybdotransferase Glp [Vicinamibacterales bacterium]|jgi:molybdenum cofactor synthesis domain-containing protein
MMRPIRETMPLVEARARVLDSAAPIGRTERAALDAAAGRVLAESPTAPLDVPPFDRAAMDGYAVRAEDTFGAGRHDPRTLRSIGTLYTGDAPARGIEAGTCLEIATGAPMPPGADAVVIVEDTERASGSPDVRMFSPVYPGQNIGRRGADIKAGTAVIERGALLNPSRIGALAAIGATDVEVYARPRVAIVSTGNEIVQPGVPLAPGQIYDINRFTLSSIVAAHGGEPVALPAPADTIEALSKALDAALESDLVVFSGGSSVGARDLIVDVLQQRGQILFHGIAVKPGKPTLLARVDGKSILGMPGYPTSCLSNGYILLAPMLRRIARLPEHRPEVRRLPLAKRVVSAAGRHQFYSVRILDGAAVPAFKASGDITSMAHADGYIEIPANVDLVEAGDTVEVILF